MPNEDPPVEEDEFSDFPIEGEEGAGDEPDEGGDELDEGETGDEAEDDSGEGDAEDDGQGNGRQAPSEAPRRGRENETIRALRRQVQAEKRRNDEFDRRLQELSAGRGQQQPTAAELEAQRRQEQERLEAMTPTEQAQYFAQQVRNEGSRQFQALRLEMLETSDKAAFQALQATNPVAKRYAGEVERVVAENKARGQLVSRENALKFVIGETVLKRGPAEISRQRKEGATRIKNQTARPGRGGGDVPSSRGRRGGDDEASLARRLGIADF